MKKLLFLGLISLLVVFYALPRSADATLININPTVDGSAQSPPPGILPSTWLLDPLGDPILRVSYDAGFPEYRAALEFDISSLTVGDTVTQVSIALHIEPELPLIELNGYMGDGSITESDFGTPNPPPPPPFPSGPNPLATWNPNNGPSGTSRSHE